MMKRSFVIACVLALTLALGLSATAGASVGAETSAKPAKKGKACKKGKKGKAGKSAAASAAPNKKGKKKPCKAKGKSKQKGSETGEPTPAPPGAATLGDGAFKDAAAKLDLTVSGGATTVVLNYTPPGGCATISYTSGPVTLTKSGDTWTASETRVFTIAGNPATAKWDLTVKSGLAYALNLTIESELDVIGLCKWEGHPTGTLTKVG